MTTYIGISGVVSIDELHAIRRIQAGLAESGADARIAVGILQSQKAIEQHVLNPRTPHPHVIDALIQSAPGLLRLVHYFTREPGSLIPQLDRLMALAGRVDGIQINVPWPPTTVTQWFGRAWPGKRVVLQVSRAAASAENDEPKRIARRVREYMPDITDVLIDLSGGTGKDVDEGWTVHMLDELVALQSRGLGVVIAGGLGTRESIERLVPMHEQFGRFSIDAKSRLRTNDQLDIAKVRTYVTAATEMLR